MTEVFGKKAITSSEFPVILFDAAGTILHYQPSLAKFYFEELKTFGRPLEFSQIEKAFERTISHFNERAEVDAQLQISPQLWTEQFLGYLSIEDKAQRDTLLKQLKNSFSTHVKLVLSQTVVDVLTTLRERDYRLAILSNLNVDLSSVLRMQGTLDLFEVVLSASDLGYFKPHPEVWKLLAEELDVNPDQIIQVGNSYAADMVGARRAGIHGVLYDPEFREVRVLAPEDVSQKVVSFEALKHNRRLEGIRVIFKFEELLEIFR